MNSPPRFRPPTRDVLEALMAAEDAYDGLIIARAARRRSAVVYPILAALEDCGWVASSWQRDEDRTSRRRVYKFTTHGAVMAWTLLTEQDASRRARSVRIAWPRPIAALGRALSGLLWGAR